MSIAIRLADRLTRKDKATISIKSGSNRAGSVTALRRDRTKSCIGSAIRRKVLARIAVYESTKLTIRVDFGGGRALGPGKIRLLEAIGKTGSISEAGRELNSSYHRAWEMVDDMKGCFRARVIKPRRGGAHGGGAALAPLGTTLVKLYRAIEGDASSAVSKHLDELETFLSRSATSLPINSIKRTLVKRKVRR
jgi:molybdate transport system regulatory protein